METILPCRSAKKGIAAEEHKEREKRAWRGAAFDRLKLKGVLLEYWVCQAQRGLAGGSRERLLMPPRL
jgi:hypothetical protein